MDKDTNEMIRRHPLYSSSDLKYLRDKGYSDDEILAFWDRDHARGCKPVEHRPIPDMLGLLTRQQGVAAECPKRTSIGRRDATPSTTRRRDEQLTAIARTVLGMETLETRNADRDDFHELGVWQIHSALRQVYSAGYEDAVTDYWVAQDEESEERSGQ